VLKAVIVGGIKGACLKPEEIDLPLDFDSVREAGGTIASGAIAVLDEGDCVVDQTKRRVAISCYDTCATCSLGREGSYQLREMVADATRGKSKGGDVEMMREVGRGMRLGAACPYGRTAPNIVLSALEKFPAEFEAHMKRRVCRALVCGQYVTFHILPELCDGCGECVDACPEDAIEGGKGKIHVIDQDECVKCGKCLEVCNDLRQAVVKAGPVKPRTPKGPVPVGSWKR
jgi:NADH-quinone oxidoreductase subunit F